MKKFGVLIISTIILFVGVVILSFFIADRLTDYKHKKEQIAEELIFDERQLSWEEYVPFYGEYVEEELIKNWQTYEQEAKAKYNGAIFYGIILIAFVLLYVAVNVFTSNKQPYKYQIYGLVMLFSAASFLFLGLQSPFIEIMAYKEDVSFTVPIIGDYTFEGRTYFLYQNKSILQLIGLLYTGGNFLVAIAVGVFSIIFPIIKLVVSIIVLLSPQKPVNIKRYKFIRNLGKWSMADIFVIAIFLAIFAFSNMSVGIDTGSETLIGTYFYIIFVILSINSGQYLKKAMKKAQEVPEGAFD